METVQDQRGEEFAGLRRPAGLPSPYVTAVNDPSNWRLYGSWPLAKYARLMDRATETEAIGMAMFEFPTPFWQCGRDREENWDQNKGEKSEILVNMNAFRKAKPRGFFDILAAHLVPQQLYDSPKQ